MSWPTVPFTEIFSDVTGGNIKTLQSDYLSAGEFPIVDQGQDLIGGYTNDPSRMCNAPSPVIVFGDHTKALKFIDFPFCLGADGTKILVPKIDAEPKYLFHALHLVPIPDAGYSRHFKYLKSATIPLPPLEEQKRIAAILDQADALRRLRRRALDRLNTLGQAIFHEMFGDPTQGPDTTTLRDRTVCTLGDQITLQRGKDITKKQATLGKVPVISSGGTSFFHNEPLVSGPGVLLGRKGSVGKVHYTPVAYWPHDTTLFVKDFKGNSPRFVYHFFKQFPISDYEASAANPSLNRNNLHPVRVFWPSQDDQRKFTSQIDNIEAELPKQRSSLKDFDHLFASLQHRAFRGEL